MIKQRILLLACVLLCSPIFAQQSVEIKFSYAGNHGVDLGKMRGSMTFAEFTDGRSIDNSKLITDSSLGNDSASAGYQAEQALPEIVRDALVQGFKAGGAEIDDSDEGMKIVGNLISSETTTVERDGVPSIQITLRTNVQLQNGGRTIWQTILFGRGVAPANEGLAAAVHAALERTVRELVGDDYFLLEVM